MCHADAAVVTHVWREGTEVPYPDFGVERQCRDFGALMEYRDTMDVEGSFDKFRFYTEKPEGAVVLPAEPGMEELMASADEERDGRLFKEMKIKGCNA